MNVIFAYFAISGLTGLVYLNWVMSARDCDCDLCQHPDSEDRRVQLNLAIRRLSWPRQAGFALIWSIFALPLVLSIFACALIQVAIESTTG